MILPGAILGVLGGGQLGRMFTAEALRMGYRVVVFDPDQQSPAGLIASYHICAAYDDTQALEEFTDLCDAATIEFENIPLQSLQVVEQAIPLSPSSESVRLAQNRIEEKYFFQNNNFATAPFHPINKYEDIDAAISITGVPCIIKTAQFGYDGKGQALCHDMSEVKKAFDDMGQVACILEQCIDLLMEVSVILACAGDGSVSAYPVAENTHTNGILDTTVVPAKISSDQQAHILSLAISLAKSLRYVGVLATEIFISRSGEILINEIAPRPHNSGHFTQNACDTSQFEQQVRMMCSLSAGSTHLHRQVAMLNILGDAWGNTEPRWETVFAIEGACLHLYAKHEARPGRKMGHVNIVGDNAALLLEQALALKSSLSSQTLPD